MNKTYYWCRLTQQAPLRIGSGFGDETDSDIMKDSRGFPFVPGTSLTGVLRSYLSEMDGSRLFGTLLPEICESHVLISDAVLGVDAKDTDFRITQRDGVGLSDDGTARKGAKYNFEVVECKKPYTAVIELADACSAEERTLLEGVLARISAEGVSFGARTTRGYGLMSAEVKKREFELPKQLETWLRFDPFEDGCFEDASTIPLDTASAEHAADSIAILLRLAFRGSFSVRVNTTVLAQAGQKVAPDQMPLSGFDGHAVIPGTAWAGSFRHHMRHLASGMGRSELMTEVDALFGAVKDAMIRSSIRFSETAAEKELRYTTTRTAVDRFTSAPRNQALFTSQVAQDGEGTLAIRLPSDTAPDLLRLLACAINDLNLGLMNVGGEGGVGRGCCEVTELLVNGEDMTASVKELKTDYLLKEVR